MSRQIDHRSTSHHSADEVVAVMLDEAYLRARLDRLGGPGATLLALDTDGDGGQYTIRHGVDQAMLPPVVGSLVSGNLVIQRTESLRRSGPGRYAGDVGVQIPGTPASASGSLQLHDVAGGSELLVRADVTVRIPFVGGRIESVIADQVLQLLVAETEFTLEWLAGKHR